MTLLLVSSSYHALRSAGESICPPPPGALAAANYSHDKYFRKGGGLQLNRLVVLSWYLPQWRDG